MREAEGTVDAISPLCDGEEASTFRPITSPVKPCIVLKNLALSVTQSSQVGFSFPLVLLVFIK